MVGVVLVAGFVLWDLREENPLTDLRLFASAPFATAGIVLATVNFAVFGLIFVLPAYVETVLSHDALVGGLLLMPLVAGAILGSLINEPVAGRLGASGTCRLGLVLLTVGAAVMGLSTVNGGLVVLGIGELGAGTGMGAAQPVALSWGLSQVTDARRGAGSSLLSVLQQLGSVLGIGVLGTVVGSLYPARLGSSGAPPAPGATSSVTIAFEQAGLLPPEAGDALRRAAGDAYTTATGACLLTCCLVTAVALAATWALVSRGARSARG